MSELALGDADATGRWMGVPRLQVALVLTALVTGAQWAVTSRAPTLLLVVAVGALVGAVPGPDGSTVAGVAAALVGYHCRSHWWRASAVVLGEDVALWAGGEVAFRGYRLEHRGRLDLAGRDRDVARDLAAALDAASAGGGHHVSVYVAPTSAGLATLLCLPPNLAAPGGWRLDPDLALTVVGVNSSTPTTRLLERVSYLRGDDHVARVYRVRDFSGVPAGHGLLERLLRSPTPKEVSVHVDVVASARAHRLAARAVHRVDSDGDARASIGFRRSARAARDAARLSEREDLVAAGRALVRLTVVVVVRGSSLDDVRARGAALWHDAHDAGLRLERGWGRQAPWYRAHLPGGLGW